MYSSLTHPFRAALIIDSILHHCLKIKLLYFTCLRLYRLNPKRELGNLFGVGKGGCTDVHSGIGNVAYVKDILTDTIVTKKFRCSKFGPHMTAALGWVICLKNTFNSKKGFVSRYIAWSNSCSRLFLGQIGQCI